MPVRRFSEHPNANNRSLRLWLILIRMAHARQTTTFGELAQLIGMGAFPPAIVPFLTRIADFCDQNGLPPLTALVLQAGGGIPAGLDALLQRSGQTLLQAQQAVFDCDWYDILPPTPEEFGQAARQVPDGESMTDHTDPQDGSNLGLEGLSRAEREQYARSQFELPAPPYVPRDQQPVFQELQRRLGSDLGSVTIDQIIKALDSLDDSDEDYKHLVYLRAFLECLKGWWETNDEWDFGQAFLWAVHMTSAMLPGD